MERFQEMVRVTRVSVTTGKEKWDVVQEVEFTKLGNQLWKGKEGNKIDNNEKHENSITEWFAIH